MESMYGVGITNRFSTFLHSDDDNDDTIKPVELEKESKKKGKIAEKENRSKDNVSGEVASNRPKTTHSAPHVSNQASGAARKGIRDSNVKNAPNDSTGNRINNRSGGDADRGYRSGPRPDRERFGKDEAREERNNRRNQDDSGRSEFVPRDGERGARRGGFGSGYRGRGGGRGGPIRKREFDRQSGSDKSGVKPVDKRDGAGSRNWGTYKDDIDEPAGTAAAEEVTEEKADNVGQTGDDGTSQETAAQPEEEPKFMTLEEYRALQTQQSRQKPVFNVRKAGEGEDQSQWKKMTLKKKEPEPNENEHEAVEEDDDKRAGRQKQTIDIAFQFSDSRRGMNGPGRGARRGGGERGRGGFNRGFRPRNFDGRDQQRPLRQAAPKVDDERDFPSLG